MKGILLIAVLNLAALAVYGQCPSTILLGHDGHCSGSGRLYLPGKDTLVRIIWYKDGKAIDTVTDALTDSIITVAGGNGSGPAANQVTFPLDVYLDGNGALYVLDIGQVKRFPPGSTSASGGVRVAGGNGQGNAANQFADPMGMFIDRAGNIYVADAHNNRIQKWVPGATNGITVAGDFAAGAGSNQLTNPTSVCFDATGNMYVGDDGNSRIQKFAPNSMIGLTVAGGNGTGSAANQFFGIQKIVVDRSGNIYVADFGNNRVQRFPANSTPASNGVTVAGGNGAGSAANQFEFPDGLFVDASGDIYVSDQVNNRIQEWVAGSSFGLTVAGGGGQGPAPDQLDRPRGIFVDAEGSIYVSDAFNNRVQKWTWHFGIDTTYTPSSPGDYTAVVTDSAGCTMTSNDVLITSAGIASVAIRTTTDTICKGDTVLFTALPTNGGRFPAYQWLVNGQRAGSNSSLFVAPVISDGDLVSCVLTSSEPCVPPVTSGTPIAMTVKPSPSVYAGNDTVLAPGKSLMLRPTVSGGTVSGSIRTYQWSPATGLDDPAIPDAVATPPHSMTYQLTVTSDNNCQASGKLHITVYFDLQMPNAFTPNDDGRNDIFRIPPVTTQRIRSFSVYDRKGMRIFRTTDAGTGWDGTYQRHKEPQGVYVWEVEYEDLLSGKWRKTHGTVMLIR